MLSLTTTCKVLADDSNWVSQCTLICSDWGLRFTAAHLIVQSSCATLVGEMEHHSPEEHGE